MAKKILTIETFTDDLTGEEIPEDEVHTVTFSFLADGGATPNYSLDLSTESLEKFEKVMAPYIEAAEKAGTAHRPWEAKQATSKTGTGPQRPGIIAWAKENGWPDAKGRPGPDIVDAYDVAHPTQGQKTVVSHLTTAERKEVSAWARKNKVPLHHAGTVSTEALNAYNAAH